MIRVLGLSTPDKQINSDDSISGFGAKPHKKSPTCRRDPDLLQCLSIIMIAHNLENSID